MAPLHLTLPLAYGLSLLTRLCPLPCHVFKEDNHYSEKFDNNERDDLNVLKTDYPFRKSILKEVREKRLTLISGERPVLFAGVQCEDGLSLIIGPVSMVKPDQSFTKLYALKHGAAGCPLQYCQPSRLAAMALLINAWISGDYISVNDFLDQNFLSEDIVEMTQKRVASVFSMHTVSARPHNPVTLELNIRKAIRQGDVDMLKDALDSPYVAMRGTLAKNELRSAQNLAIVDITIATREAIDAGLSVEELYIISDAFILEVEECRCPEEAAALARACALRCTQMVAQRKNESLHDATTSSVVQRACNYIDRHLYEKLDVAKMAEKLKISRGYLSRVFREGMGMTLPEYARKRKIEIASTLLADSDRSIEEIALLLGFSSQSHFGQAFVREMKITPRQYRTQHQI